MMSTQGFKHRNLPHLFLSAREMLMRRFRPILNEAGLTEQQWRVLRVLYDKSDLSAAELADQAQILSPSLTRMLRLLQQSNLVDRHADPKDLRRQFIRLSDKGRQMVNHLGPRIEATYQELEALIGPKLLSSLYRDVDTMLARIEYVSE